MLKKLFLATAFSVVAFSSAHAGIQSFHMVHCEGPNEKNPVEIYEMSDKEHFEEMANQIRETGIGGFCLKTEIGSDQEYTQVKKKYPFGTTVLAKSELFAVKQNTPRSDIDPKEMEHANSWTDKPTKKSSYRPGISDGGRHEDYPYYIEIQAFVCDPAKSKRTQFDFGYEEWKKDLISFLKTYDGCIQELGGEGQIREIRDSVDSEKAKFECTKNYLDLIKANPNSPIIMSCYRQEF